MGWLAGSLAEGRLNLKVAHRERSTEGDIWISKEALKAYKVKSELCCHVYTCIGPVA